nr:Chain A, navitoxin [synthetic construct]
FSCDHSACAVRCLAQRRKGGKCKNGDCVCR